MKKYFREIIILLLALATMFFATRTYRLHQVLELQNEIQRQNILIQNTRNMLIRSNLLEQSRQAFNSLGWNLPEQMK